MMTETESNAESATASLQAEGSCSGVESPVKGECPREGSFAINQEDFGVDEAEFADFEDSRLVQAIFHGDYDLAELCLEAGDDIEVVGPDGVTPLLCACVCDDEVLVKILIDHGADVLAADKFGATPLHSAAFNNNYNIVRRLLFAGADPVAVDCEGYCPIDFATANAHVSANGEDVLVTLAAACENLL